MGEIQESTVLKEPQAIKCTSPPTIIFKDNGLDHGVNRSSKRFLRCTTFYSNDIRHRTSKPKMGKVKHI